MKLAAAFAIAVFASASASAQHGAAQGTATATAHPAAGSGDTPTGSEIPLLRPLTRWSPWHAMRYLRDGNAAVAKAGRPLAPRPRPHGPGRKLAAVALATSSSVSAGELLGVAHRDLLVLSSPGPLLRMAEVAAIERGVEQEQIQLLVILVDKDDPHLARDPRPRTDPARTLQRDLEPAFALAQRDGVSLHVAHGVAQADRVFAQSRLLAARRLEDRFRIAVGIVDAKRLTIDWVTKWDRRWRLVTSEGAAAVARLQPKAAPHGPSHRFAANRTPEHAPEPHSGATHHHDARTAGHH
ncbi:MAG: hypothetical protein H6836_02960 [Planctomycetes bacterium]|nr:hypothetical protein [Planctomycetota bacterium]MCB9888512.1 hypothetical protein [Planctomycetota bacterium]